MRTGGRQLVAGLSSKREAKRAHDLPADTVQGEGRSEHRGVGLRRRNAESRPGMWRSASQGIGHGLKPFRSPRHPQLRADEAASAAKTDQQLIGRHRRHKVFDEDREPALKEARIGAYRRPWQADAQTDASPGGLLRELRHEGRTKRGQGNGTKAGDQATLANADRVDEGVQQESHRGERCILTLHHRVVHGECGLPALNVEEDGERLQRLSQVVARSSQESCSRVFAHSRHLHGRNG